MQLPGGFARSDGGEGFEKHGASIETRFHLHDRHAGFRVTSQNRAMNRRSAAPSRQERAVNIEAAKARNFARNIQHHLRQDQSVRSDHHHVRRKRGQFGNRLGRFEIHRLQDR